MRKGNKVRIVSRRGQDFVMARRPMTSSEVEFWYASDASKGMNCAGETKLPPTAVSYRLPVGNVYTVLRARCRARLSYGNPTPGLCLIKDEPTGEALYVSRMDVEVVS